MSPDPLRGRRRPSEATLLGVLLAIALAYVAQAWRIGFGELSAPGSGLYPALVGIAIALTCAARIAALRRSHHPAPRPARESSDRDTGDDDAPTPPIVYAMFGVLVGFALAQAVIGFVPALGLMVFVAQRVTRYRTWRRSMVVAIMVVTVVELVFRGWLKVPFPTGMLGPLVG